MLKVLKKAGLSADDFAKILGVSRVAVFNWRAGRSKPHTQLRERVSAAEEFLEALVARNKLPFAAVDRKERAEKIARLKGAFKDYVR